MRTYKLFLVCLLVVSIIGCARNEPLPSGNEQQEKQSYGFQGLPSDRDINKHKTYVDEEVHAYAEEARIIFMRSLIFYTIKTTFFAERRQNDEALPAVKAAIDELREKNGHVSRHRATRGI